MKKKNLFIAAASVLAIAACTSDDLVSVPERTSGNDNGKAMSFSVGKNNITRASNTKLEAVHNQFGVWAVKNITSTSSQYVMENYLVGWGGKGGYNPAGATTVPTTGTPVNPTESTLTDNLSWWFYEGLGTSQYKNTNTDYILTANNPSANTEQYLKYWDYSSTDVDFYAYVPYSKNSVTTDNDLTDTEWNALAQGTVVFNKNQNKLSVTGLWAAFDNPAASEHLLAYTNVAKTGYAKDVPLTFKRTNGEVRLSFWEDIKGYDVSVDNIVLKTVKETVVGGKKTYTEMGTMVLGGDVSIVKPVAPATEPTVVWEGVHRNTEIKTITGFGKPEGIAGTAPKQATYKRITKTQANAHSYNYPWTLSPNIFYCLPADQTPKAPATTATFNGDNKANLDTWENPNCGFLVTLDYTLYSLDTNERIKVTGATVYVGPEYTQWVMNKRYLYVFKITENTNGYTNPDDPAGLYPIVFDNIEVEPMDEWTSDDIIVTE